MLGTGKMGAAIAARLDAAGFELVVWNRTRSRAEALGIGRVADTPAEASRGAAFVISSLTGADAVRVAYLGPGGAIGGASRQLFIDMSTAGTEIGAELAASLASHGARFVEAPILGSPTVVATGGAAILAGGEPADVERAIPILRALGAVRSVGRLGQASRLKLVANSMLGDVIESAAELQVAGEAADLDPDEVFWVLQRIVPSLEGRRGGLVDGRHAPAQFALRDLRKDLDLAIAAFDESQTPLTHAAAGLVRAAAARTPDLDISAVALPYRRVAQPPAADVP
jgi:3-hydroxyisobutyrate dehydrogenase-like beta-hydroxyacid dehydrogenase